MIKRLRRRMTLMVVAVLILVSAGIVLAIHLADEHSIAVQRVGTETVDCFRGESNQSAAAENIRSAGIGFRTRFQKSSFQK